jgi:hypothetical protein
MLIKRAFSQLSSTTKPTTAHTDVYSETIKILNEQLRVKDSQIAELTEAVKMQIGKSGKARKYYFGKRQFKKSDTSIPIKRLYFKENTLD